jgi:hypothetical protein
LVTSDGIPTLSSSQASSTSRRARCASAADFFDILRAVRFIV